MPGQPIPFAVDAATFAGLSADDYPDGQRVVVTDDSNRQYEARGADGDRTWVEIGIGINSGRWEVLLDLSSQPVDNGDNDWLYVWVEG